MKSRDLLKAIGEIDDSFILEADGLGSARTSRERIRTRNRIIRIAACFAVVLLAGIYGLTGGFGGRLSKDASDQSYSINSGTPTSNSASLESPTREDATDDGAAAPETPSPILVASDDQPDLTEPKSTELEGFEGPSKSLASNNQNAGNDGPAMLGSSNDGSTVDKDQLILEFDPSEILKRAIPAPIYHLFY